MAPPSNIPVALTPLIGREAALIAISALLEQVRLLTITGPGGVGKTRLALALAGQHAARFSDGVFVVDLAPLRDPAQVPAAIADVVGLRELPGQPLLTMLTNFLRERCLLLVLDNVEHLLAGASVIETLLAACPSLCVLVTSRAALQLQGEYRYVVTPLGLPAAETEPLEVVAHCPAVALFMARAQVLRPEFVLTDSNAAVVAAICCRLDGLPLALELAAVRLNVLSPDALLARLDQRLPLLAGGRRSAPARQQTLRATLSWSYDLLAADEQTLFRRLAVFVGGWTLEAAEQVCDLESHGAVLSTLASLLDHNLVQTRPGSADEPRFSMLETMREYALEQLVASSEAAALQERHALTFLALAEAAAPDVATVSVNAAWQLRLEREHDNLRAALAWYLTSPDRSDEALRLAAALGAFWHTHSYLSEGRRWLEQALAAGQQASASSRAGGLAGLGTLAWRQSDYATARSSLETALALWQELSDDRGTAHALQLLGQMLVDEGQLAPGRALIEQSLSLWRRRGNPGGLLPALRSLATVARTQGDYATATAAVDEALMVACAQPDPGEMAKALRQQGRLAFEHGDLVRAAHLFEHALAIHREQTDRSETAVSLNALTQVALAAGDWASASRYGEEALAQFAALGMEAQRNGTHLALGHAARLAGDGRRAASQYVARLVRYPAHWGRARYALAGIAWTALWLGRPVQAARLLAATRALPHAPFAWQDHTSRPFYETDLLATQTALGTEAFAQAWAAGEALTPEQATAEALALAEEIAALPAEQATVDTAPRSGAAYSDGLTRREVEVLQLVAQGESNRAIAAALVLSVRTVERHLDNIYAKTGLHGRQQLRAYARSTGLVPSS